MGGDWTGGDRDRRDGVTEPAANGVTAAQAAQRRALHPDESVWVAASAGTGKTKVLTDRLLALMLGGTDPAHILCLTFTRAAAAEMANRVNDRLAKWTTMPPGALAMELVELTGRNPDEYDIARARQLFARVLDVPGGAKILTIHAFCQSLLSRFPLEAGVPPEFVVLDERGAGEALAEAVEAVVNAARAERHTTNGLAEALAVVARHAPEERFAELMADIVKERGKLRVALGDGEIALRRRLCTVFSVSHEITGGGLITSFCAYGACDETGLRAAAAALADGSDSDRRRGVVLARWCEEPAARAAMLGEYLDLLLTDRGAARQTLITKKAAEKAAGDPVTVLQEEAARARRFFEDRAAHALVEATLALARIADAVLAAYDRRKRLLGLLDYDDLVLKALDLLRRPGIAPWVLFKLDGGLDHVLIDEAQDTNPEQWEIVGALAAEFFAGNGAHDRVRTVFAVGDPKQSIYSFQRADPQAFVDMRRYFEERVIAIKQRWVEVPLDISFRAAEPLLHAVDAVFRQDNAADGVALDGAPIRHVAAYPGHAGLVELWPAVPADDEASDSGDGNGPRHPPEPRTRLARAIAATIAGWLDGGERLEPRGRALQAGDVIVLVRRRNAFVGDLLRALKTRGVPVAGADRLALAGELAVQDLIALGRFLLLPEDDLTLATVLKGPLFGFSEDALFELAHGRGDDRLWTRLRRLARQKPAMREAYDRLRALLARADFVPPFELYAEILGTGAGRRAILERLGAEAADPVEEFLALALAYERDHVPSLQGFLRWIASGDIEVKRDFGERQRDELRILTVHGAKGLEAPVVFLPDTVQLPDRRGGVLWNHGANGLGGLPLWCPRTELAAPAYVRTREALRLRHLQEYRRLLYVALTRAQYRLFVCGWQNQKPTREAPCWHALCQSGWTGLAETVAFDTRPLIGERHGGPGGGLRLSISQSAPPRREGGVAGWRFSEGVPAGVLAPPPPEPSPPKPLAPSRPSGPEPATLSPL